MHGLLLLASGFAIVGILAVLTKRRAAPYPTDPETRKWGVIVDSPDSAIGGGWFVEVDDRRIAELTEPRCDMATPFWLSYVIVPLTEDPEERARLFTLDFWHSSKIAYRSKKFGVVSSVVLVGGTPPCPETHRIIMRGFHVELDPGPSLVERFIGLFKRRNRHDG